MFEKIFRTYFWVFNVIFLLMTSYFMAQTTSNMVRYFFPPSPAYVPPRQSSNNTVVSRLRAEFAILNKSNLFDPKQSSVMPRKAPPKVVKKKKVDPHKKHVYCDPDGDYSKLAQLPLEFKAASLTSDERYNLAVIYDLKRRKNFVVRQGENFFGIRICKISAQPPKGVSVPKTPPSKKNYQAEPKKAYVYIDRGRNKLAYLELGRKGKGSGDYRRSLYRTYQRLRNTKLNLDKIKKTGNDQYRISRDFLDKLTQRLDIVASQAAIVPYFEKGKSAGFRIFRIRRGSLYEKLGIRNGDVIKRINGYEFTTPQKALEAYSNLMSATNLSVEIKRGGRMKQLRYEIK